MASPSCSLSPLSDIMPKRKSACQRIWGRFRFRFNAAVGAWAAMRARRDSGEISEEEYLDWKRGFGGR